jgi:TRAP-type C4-dicarboxylate transport system permease small subunit
MGIVFLATISVVMLVVTDVVLRRVFDHPLAFSYELTGLLLVLLVWGSILFSTAKERHIRVDIVVGRFPQRTRRLLDQLFDFSSGLLLLIVSLASLLYARREYEMGHVSEILSIPFYPFVLVCAAGALFCGLILLLGRPWKARQ